MEFLFICLNACSLLQKFILFCQILLFPEGTDLTKHTKWRSDLYAEKTKLPKYDFVLHPRTTGFTHIVQEMKKGMHAKYGSPHDKTCLWGFRQSETQTSLLSYRD